MGKALYRKYRSRKLSEIVGQEHVTTLLENALKKDRVAHAYLFTGPRGVGKTSIARILAHEINGLEYADESTSLDIIEIDAASNNGVDDIRDLREKVNLAPLSAKKKIYIIDEVHMLSKPAFNALLKTLEEPPEHVVFILATTDVEKLPDTIISRTQRHSFHRASEQNIIKNLKDIAKREKIALSSEAIKLIARHSDGSFRDSVSLLDQLANSRADNDEISAELVEMVLGLAPDDQIAALLDDVESGKFSTMMMALSNLEDTGIQPRVIASQLISLLRERLAHKPELTRLLDDLLSVAGSALPSAKLLAVLGAYCVAVHPTSSKPHTEAAAVTARSVVAKPIATKEPLPELAKKATEPHPKDDIIASTTDAPDAQVAHPTKKSSQPTPVIDTNQLLTDAYETGIGLHSILKQSGFTQDSTTLTIYVKNAFNKKRLDTAKNMRLLADCLAKQSAEHVHVDVVPSAKPSDNSDIAAIAAIMGGGEEVEVS